MIDAFDRPIPSVAGDTAYEGESGAAARATHRHDRTADATSLLAAAPPGVISMFGGSAAPSGWLLCDGSAVSRTTYAALFAVFSTTYGTGDGSTTFNLPNLKGAVPTGLDASQTEFNALGKTGGAKTATLASANLPAHAHDITHTHGTPATATGGFSADHNHSMPAEVYANALGTGTPNPVSAIAAGATTGHFSATFPSANPTGNASADHTHTLPGMTTNSQSTTNSGNGPGSATPVSVLEPYLVLNFIVKT